MPMDAAGFILYGSNFGPCNSSSPSHGKEAMRFLNVPRASKSPYIMKDHTLNYNKDPYMI